MMTENRYMEWLNSFNQMEEARERLVEEAQTEETTKHGFWVDALEREPSEDGRYMVKGSCINGDREDVEFVAEMDYYFYYDEIFNEVWGKWDTSEMEKKGYSSVDVFEWTPLAKKTA